MKLKTYFRTICLILMGASLLLASAASADPVDERLPQELPAQVKAAARDIIRAGLGTEDVVQLVQAMHANRFDAEHMLAALSIVVETQRKGLPAKPVINKAFEGMTKQVTPDRTLQAMKTVSSRYDFAYRQTMTLTNQEDRSERLGNVLAEGLAAGLAERDAAQILNRLQEKSRQMSPDQVNDLATVSLTMARDMSRLGVSSAAASEVVASALSKGFTAGEIASMHQAIMAQSQTHSPQSLAQSYAAAVQQGQMPQGVAGAGHGSSPAGGSHGGSSGTGGSSGGGGGAGGSGGGSGGGGGPGGGGSGGAGGGNR